MMMKKSERGHGRAGKSRLQAYEQSEILTKTISGSKDWDPQFKRFKPETHLRPSIDVHGEIRRAYSRAASLKRPLGQIQSNV